MKCINYLLGYIAFCGGTYISYLIIFLSRGREYFEFTTGIFDTVLFGATIGVAPYLLGIVLLLTLGSFGKRIDFTSPLSLFLCWAFISATVIILAPQFLSEAFKVSSDFIIPLFFLGLIPVTITSLFYAGVRKLGKT